jgi:hypothetical protein
MPEEIDVEEQEQRRVSFVGPMLLIAVGTILLLNVLEVLDWSIWWSILHLWPIFLIAAGLDLLLGRRSVWGPLLAAVLVLAILAGALWLSVSDVAGGRGLTSEQIHQPLGGAAKAAVAVDPGAGILRIEALPESAVLVEGVIHVGEGERVAQDYAQSGAQATFELRTEGGQPWVPFGSGLDARRLWDLGLSPGATLQVNTSLGLGEAALDLTGLTLSDLQTNMGIGLTRITLPDEGQYRGRLDGAIGVTTIDIPEGLGARLHVDTGIAARQLPDDYREQGDNVYVSPGYETAESRVDLDISQAIGLLRIRHAE